MSVFGLCVRAPVEQCSLRTGLSEGDPDRKFFKKQAKEQQIFNTLCTYGVVLNRRHVACLVLNCVCISVTFLKGRGKPVQRIR